MRTTIPVPLAAAVLLLSGAHARAQVCYENDAGCYSFAPPAPEVGALGEGLSLGSKSLTISGDIRLRARMAEAPSDAPYNEADQQATRARIRLDFQATDSARVFAEFLFAETWAGSEKYSDADPANPFDGFSQFYVHVEDMLGWGDTWRFGRSLYTLGNGLILGSCDFLQYPSTFTGVWASKEFSGHHVEAFGFDDRGQLNLQPARRFVGGTARFAVGEEQLLESVEPYLMVGTRDGDAPNDDAWYGLTLRGTAPAAIGWKAELAHRDVDGGSDNGAYRVVLDKDFEGPVQRVALTRTGSEGAMHVNPADFNTAGLIHQYGGAWRSELETTQLKVQVDPGHELDLDVALLHFDGDAATQGEFEGDVTLGRQLASGLYVRGGYGLDDEHRQVGYVQFTVNF